MSTRSTQPTDFITELRHLDRGLDLPEARRAEHRRAIATILKRRFECSLVTLWCMHEIDGQRALGCSFALDDEPSPVPPDTVLMEADFPEYFGALARHGVYASADAMADAHLARMRDGYLIPQRIRALLDASVRVNGVTLGVLCIEQRDAPRTWSRTDQADLRRAGTTISVTLARYISAALARNR
jgi:two-component system, sensor histidine kinase and response regulator